MRLVVCLTLLTAAFPAASQSEPSYGLPFASEGNAIALTLERTDATPPLDGASLRASATPAWIVVHPEAPKPVVSDEGEVTVGLRFDVAREAPVGEAGTLALEVVDETGHVLATRTYTVEVEAPTDVSFGAPRPNPVRDRARLPFEIPRDADVTVDVYDLLGRRVETLLGARVAAGGHHATLDAQKLAAGVYVVRLVSDADGHVEARTHRVTVVR